MRLVTTAVLLLVMPLLAQNSTRKVRQRPGETAQRAGSAVAWQDDFDRAVALAKAGGKPVFWYVPTLAGSPMDRKPEIDRYLMAGPFSWPTTIDLLNRHFVPLRLVPKGELQQRFGLLRMKFLEPGYLVLQPDGAVALRVDQITTLHPQWFEAPLRRLANAPLEGFPGAPALREAWTAYRGGDREQARVLVDAVLGRQPGAAVAAEALWLRGAALCRDNQRAAAERCWQQLAARFPDEPLAWKAAMEAEGHGPFGRGFEDYLPLPEAVLRDPPTDGSRAQRSTYAEPELWARSTAFLLAMDDGDGVLRDSTYDFGGTDSLPNVHAAISCLVGAALLAAQARLESGAFVLPERERVRLDAMLSRLRTTASSDDVLALQDRDEILWAHAYRARFLAAWCRLLPQQAKDVTPALQQAVDAMFALQPQDGVWFHEYGNPFAIATALQALHEARAYGANVDPERVDRGLGALLQCRTEPGGFSYNHPGKRPARTSLEAAAGRMPLCELALWLYGRSDQQRLLFAVDTGFRHHALLAAVRKYDDHADSHGYGGFFFWFDMLARAEATMQLADAAERDRRRAQQRKLVLDLAEFDGCFVDSHELGRAYGTAMALLSLAVLDG